MLIATSLALAVFASSLAGAAAPVASSIPPVVVTVAVAPTVPPTLVARLLEEAAAVWRAGGVTLVWRRTSGAAAPRARTIEAQPCADSGLRVVIGNDRGPGGDNRRDNLTVLGWIVFSDGDTPDNDIYLSHENAGAYLASARPVVGLRENMPIAERELLLGRAMGRALAHEVGHYLLSSKVHTARGLMQASHTAAEFFGGLQTPFAVDAAQREAVASRLRRDRLTALLQDVR